MSINKMFVSPCPVVSVCLPWSIYYSLPLSLWALLNPPVIGCLHRCMHSPFWLVCFLLRDQNSFMRFLILTCCNILLYTWDTCEVEIYICVLRAYCLIKIVPLACKAIVTYHNRRNVGKLFWDNFVLVPPLKKSGCVHFRCPNWGFQRAHYWGTS